MRIAKTNRQQYHGIASTQWRITRTTKGTEMDREDKADKEEVGFDTASKTTFSYIITLIHLLYTEGTSYGVN